MVQNESIKREDLMLINEFPVIQITNKGNYNVPQYFTHNSWINNKELLFISDNNKELLFISDRIQKLGETYSRNHSK